jgi:hypothetical protein
MVPELVDKYIWLLQTIIDAGPRGLSFQEISRRWCERYGVRSYSRRTFHCHREAIESIFGVPILCNRSSNTYTVESGSDAVDERQSIDWLISTFTVGSLLTLGKERLSGRVGLEEIPSGSRYLTEFIQAMLDGAEVRIGYRKYMSADTESRTIRPYAVKESERRWYVVAYSQEAGALRVYALDRITTLERTGGHFRMPKGFNVDETFANSYGVYLPESEPVLVKLRTTAREAAYLQDLPLHPSQIRLPDEGEYALFALRVIPNPQLVMELCRHGNRLEVLEPKELREAVIREHQQALALYAI